ncbi:chemotaxis protein CheA [Lipingzhangella sp. LS1_29]|uniref:Chemotaxis protein CheA n=1 Tax=Lipingzhangella rawalii TaxID=2055835 RepID=A0ABU2H497_9ACTN|nr:chemotaxis protein CheA [Lipingzhangella rawalii]MDS1269822.1 chemotaxis protein CheA [Lipingzhangella rawalii]
MVRRLLHPALAGAVLTVPVLALGAAPASAADAPDVDEVATALEQEHVYFAPEIDELPDAEADAVYTAAQEAENPVYIAVLPEDAFASNATAEAFAQDLTSEVGADGTYAVAWGNNLYLNSNVMNDGSLQDVYRQAQSEPTAVDGLVTVADASDQAISGEESAAASGMVLLGILGLLVLGGGFFLYNSKRKRDAKAAQELADIRKMAEEDVTRLGEDITQLDIDLTKVDEDTRRDYEQAMDAYDRAKSSLEAIRTPEDVRQVTTALEDGRYYMNATRARLNGDPVPERRSPCFFNPQHGPSVEDVLWAPPGGTDRSVPACASCSQAVRAGHDPDVRMVEVDGQRRPYYDAGPAYAPYAGGYFGMNMMMGMFTGMMMGSMMGSMMGAGMGAGMGDMGAEGGDMGGDLGGDDFGGGFGDSFGGGDLGDFGGFDF